MTTTPGAVQFLKPMLPAIFFNAHHAPVGAFATFTLGTPGGKGGLGLELACPANENVFIALETALGGAYEALPFFASGEDESKRFDVGAAPMDDAASTVRPFPREAIERDFRLGSDTWRAGDLTFTIYSAVKPVPDPATASAAALKEALVPAVFVEITVDNTRGERARKVCFGYEGRDARSNMRRLEGAIAGVGLGLLTAMVSRSPGVRAVLGFSVDRALDYGHEGNLGFGLGNVGVLFAEVPAGEKKTLEFAVCFHRAGIVTTGLPCTYFYTRFFPDLEAVAAYSLENWGAQKRLALASDAVIERAALSPARRFQLCQAVRSYYGSTQFLDAEGAPFWVVNEGEYRMMNTFDLTVDHLFFELAQNPWVVRDQLDWFVRRFRYEDRVRLPGDEREHPGGLSFTHDMGVMNNIAPPHFSSYERFGLHGCFSHMTHEQLVNWVLTAVTYLRTTQDTAWLETNRGIFAACLESLINRDHPDPAQRDGVMSADSTRCGGGAEITTYDSLDVSLGQARNNLYLAVKTWAAYLGLEQVLGEARAGAQAARAAQTIVKHLRPDGFIPAILGEGNESRIIPAIEGLVFPHVWGMDAVFAQHGELSAALQTHLRTVLVPGVCLFPDGAWKLSSTNDNSWLSKIYLCQFVAERILDFTPNPAADEAHARWLSGEENGYFAWSDQMIAGLAKASKYYPRGVTAWLWLRARGQ